MKHLSREARTLLDSARLADAAPLGVKQRARKNFVNAITAGTIGTSAAVAKATSMSALNSAAHAGASVAAGSSLTVTVVSAVVTGVSLGMIALSPASKTVDASAPVVTVHSVAPSPMQAGKKNHQTQRREQQTFEPEPADMSAPTVSAHTPTARFQRLDAIREPTPNGTPTAAPEHETAATVPLDSTAAFDAITSTPPSRVSIGRETELLAEVQRALQRGRAASALTLLKRYSTEFPQGALEEESIASRVVALCQFGREDDAARWRTEFSRRYPNSPLGGRVRNACPAVGAGSSEPGAK